MRTSAVTIAPLLAVLIACALLPGSAQASTSDNIATAIIEHDAGTAFDFAWDISRQRGGVVDHRNEANAAARCTGCQATAIAFQIVIASDADQAGPVNLAVALNHQCTQCTVIAEARQFVRVFDRPAKLTGAGRAELSDVRRTLRALEAQQLPIDQLHLAVEEQEARVEQVLDTELVMRSDPDAEADEVERWMRQDSELD
jgi:putative peptide zinc metalloprotease protein